jgi:phytoene dehydrogenase-like protein
MDSQFAHTDVVVVGGGLAGLSAACYLARSGVAVTLFEKASSLGGRAATQNYDEYCFNRGIHALYYGGAASRVLQELGIVYSGHSPKDYFMLRQGKLHVLPSNPLALLRTDGLDAADKLELTRLSPVFALLKAHELRRVSVQEWLERTVQRPRVRQVVASLARTFTYSAALDQVSTEVFATQMRLSLKHNVLYIDGGWQALIDGLRSAAERAGARIVTGVRVEAIECGDGRVQGVRLRDGSTVHASTAIIAADPQDAAKLVDEGAYPALRQAVDAIVPIQVACLDVALRRLPASHHPVVFDLERPRFQSIQSLFTKITPPGGALIHTVKYLDPAHPSDPREDEHDLENLLDTSQPGWREELVKRIYLPRMDAASMLPSASGGGFAGRPGPQVPGVANLYLAGDWIGSEGFLTDASMASARQVAQLILRGDLAPSRPIMLYTTSGAQKQG